MEPLYAVKKKKKQKPDKTARRDTKYQPRETMTCAHHGAINRPNNLAATCQLLDAQSEIGVVEVDFISLPGGRFVASHDYHLHNPGEQESEENSLAAWVRALCVERGVRLYIDAKPRHLFLSLFVAFDSDDKFDSLGLLTQLNRLNDTLLQPQGASSIRGRASPNIDLRRLVWIASQDYDVIEEMRRLNDSRRYGWEVICDLPYTGDYPAHYLLPSCLWPFVTRHQEALHDKYLSYDYSQSSVVAIDCEQFGSPEAVTRFVRESSITRKSTIVLYAFERSVPTLEIPGYTVMMMYDYVI